VADIRFKKQRLTQDGVIQKRTHRLEARFIPALVTDTQDLSGPCARANHARSASRRHGQRLFAKQFLTGGNYGQTLFLMQGMWRRQDYSMQLGVSQNVRKVVNLPDAIPPQNFARPVCWRRINPIKHMETSTLPHTFDYLSAPPAQSGYCNIHIR
jgi:hypothetical protein